jgi:hypothetical protein
LLKHTDITIHWKALEEHFLMVPLVFWFNHFRGKKAFSEFFSKVLWKVRKQYGNFHFPLNASCESWLHWCPVVVKMFLFLYRMVWFLLISSTWGKVMKFVQW